VCPANQQVLAEIDNEPWNFGYLGGTICQGWSALFDYVTPGTSINPYVTVAGSGNPKFTRMLSVAVLSSLLFDALQAAFDAIGTGIQVIRTFSTQYTASNITSHIIPEGQTLTGSLVKKVPIGAISIGTYGMVE
jgi:hypothetical protein